MFPLNDVNILHYYKFILHRKEAHFALLSRLREPNLYKNYAIIWSKITLLWFSFVW